MSTLGALQRSINLGTGSGPGGGVEVKENGVTKLANALILNFINGATIVPNGPNQADITIATGNVLSGAAIPEGAQLGAPGDLYVRTSGTATTFWAFAGIAPGVNGWVAIGPELTGTAVGAINGLNTTFTFPGGLEAIFQTASPSVQIDFRYNGQELTPNVHYTVIPGSQPGLTISGVQTTSFVAVPQDVLTLKFIPA